MTPAGIRIARLGLLAVALALGAGAGLLLDLGPEPSARSEPQAGSGAANSHGPGNLATGGTGASVEFDLTNQHGERVSAGQLRGQVLLVFFGYTHCPDVCPTTLVQMKLAREQLGADARDFQGVFITIDPARDTEARLRDYVGHFDGSLLGLTGAPGDIASAARSFGAFYERGDDVPGGYLMGHTAFGYLVDREGRIGNLFPNDASVDEIVSALKAAIAARDTPAVTG